MKMTKLPNTFNERLNQKNAPVADTGTAGVLWKQSLAVRALLTIVDFDDSNNYPSGKIVEDQVKLALHLLHIICGLPRRTGVDALMPTLCQSPITAVETLPGSIQGVEVLFDLPASGPQHEHSGEPQHEKRLTFGLESVRPRNGGAERGQWSGVAEQRS